MRSHPRTAGVLATALCAASILAVPSAASAAAISNGDFEAGFTGWTKSTQGSGDWYVYSGTTAPSGQAVAAPPQGTKAATTDQSGAGSHVLYQDVALEASARHTLTFKLYYHNSASSFVSPNTLDQAGAANQQYRIDVMSPAAPIRSVAAADVLATVFKTKPGDPATLTPTTITFDLTPFAGQTVRLRFAEADNQLFFAASVDDVAIDTVLIDSQAPVTTITAGPADDETTSTSTPTFEFDSNESGSSFVCSVDGGEASACTSPFTATTLDDGTHTFSVAATDAAGNTEATPATRSFTVTTPTADVSADESAGAPAPAAAPPASCVSRRRFTIRLRPANVPLVSAVVKVHGKRVTVRKTMGRMTAAVDLRGRAKGMYAVTIDARDARHRHFKEIRRFRTC